MESDFHILPREDWQAVQGEVAPSAQPQNQSECLEHGGGKDHCGSTQGAVKTTVSVLIVSYAAVAYCHEHEHDHTLVACANMHCTFSTCV